MNSPADRPYGATGSVWSHGRALLRRDGFGATVARLATYPNTPWIRYLWSPAVGAARALSGATRFRWEDRELRYGPTIGERAVEVPIALDWVGRGPVDPSDCLEVGNVLNHHAPFPHVVVDRYERAPGVLNVDIVDFRPGRRFRAIVSVSTLEHVGFDESPRSPGKFRSALHHLVRDCLRPDGRMLVTLPLGYNPEVDEFVRSDVGGEFAWSFYRRRGLRNLWGPISPEDVRARPTFPPYSYVRHRLAWLAVGRRGEGGEAPKP